MSFKHRRHSSWRAAHYRLLTVHHGLCRAVQWRAAGRFTAYPSAQPSTAAATTATTITAAAVLHRRRSGPHHRLAAASLAWPFTTPAGGCKGPRQSHAKGLEKGLEREQRALADAVALGGDPGTTGGRESPGIDAPVPLRPLRPVKAPQQEVSGW